MTVRVLLVDDHDIVREGLRSIIARREPEMTVVGESTDGAGAIVATREEQPDVVVMDLTMPGLNGIDATNVITSESPTARVLCVSMHSDSSMVSAVLEAGASGYLAKECAGSELVEAIRTVNAAQVYLSPSVTNVVVSGYLAHLAAARSVDEPQLSVREREVLQLLAEGHSTSAIAERLFISPKTVGTHREHIKAKVGISSVACLTKYAIRHGITTPE